MIALRFLIDENLSTELSALAHARGFAATHVNHLGLREWKDWNILDVVERESWTLVTNNAIEFRRRYLDLGVHAGVIFLLPSVRRAAQIVLFNAALDDLMIDPDLTNHAMDVEFGDHGGPVVRRYALSGR